MNCSVKFADNAQMTVLAQINSVVYATPYAAILERDGQIATIIAEWIDGGGVIAPFEVPTPTAQDFATAAQSHVDAVAQARGYSNGVALAGYSTSTIPAWAAEAAAFIAWRDAVWIYAYTELAKVQGGQREVPTVAELIEELPTIVWP
jgi:hypothetical protein